MSEPDSPVFVDPSGRRRRLVRALAVLGAVLVAGYLGLVLVAAMGGPDSPAARLPLLPEHPPAANPQPGMQPLPVAPTTTTIEPGTTLTQPQRTTTTTPPAAAPPPPPAPPPPAVTSTRPAKGSRPSQPPGNGGPHTSPPGNGG